MIDVSPLTHLAQQQPVAADVPRPVRAVSPVDSARGAESGGARDSSEKRKFDGLGANVIRGGDSSLQFRIDQDSERLVVSLLDQDGKVIRQVPSEVVLRIAQRIEQIQASGKLGFDARA